MSSVAFRKLLTWEWVAQEPTLPDLTMFEMAENGIPSHSAGFEMLFNLKENFSASVLQ